MRTLWLERYFKFPERQTTLSTEILAGTTTFLAMAYIMFVNPSILASAGMDRTALITVTCVVTALATLATGLLANAPIAPWRRAWGSMLFLPTRLCWARR